MNTSFWASYISDATIKAICWTLIHSLWIGMIIALIAGVIVSLTRKSAAALRYRLLCAVLVLFIVSIGVTWYVEARSNATIPVRTGAGKVFISTIEASPSVPIAVAQNQNIIDRSREFLNQNMSVIFMIWLLFFILKSLKMVSGLLYIQRIRNYKIHPVSEELKHKIELFSSQVGIRRAVRLVQSELVKVPVAIGWLKPMILLPLGIALQLTPEQLDGILWHELAHIHRRDYLVNILQGLVETVFFFNPGLLWLSSLIRTEREACCDDMVLSRMNRKANYLEALLSFGYGEFKQAGLAMSIGSGNQLRDRLKRMISQENKRLSVAEKSVLAIGLVLLSAFTTISKNNPIIKHLTVKFTNKFGKVSSKTMTVSMHRLPENQRVNDSKPGGSIKDTIILTDTAISFKSVLFKHSDENLANNDISAMDDKGTKYHFIIAGNKLTAMELNGEKVSDDKLAGFEYMIRNIGRELATKRRVRAEDIAAYKANSPAVKFKGKDTVGFNKRKHVGGQSADMVPPKQYDKQRYANGQEPKARYLKLEAMRDRFHDDSINYAGQQQRALNVIADLVTDKIVPDAASVKWFGLSNTEFIVNGQKQPGEMQQRYKAKYGIYEGNGLYYGPVQMHGVGVFIDATATNDRIQRLPRQPKAPRGPDYKGAIEPKYTDSVEWKNQQLMRQQQLFAADQARKRQKLIQQQQIFSAEQGTQREQIIAKQRLLLADQQKQFEGLQRWWTSKDSIDMQPVIASVISDLVNANVISDRSDLIKFNLTNSALLVNGKKQPDELHEKLKAKYLEQPNYPLKFGITDDPNFGLHFNSQNGAMGIGITNGPDSP